MKTLEAPFTLSLSSGFFGFYAHVGFLKALEDLRIQPTSYSGASAGAIIAAAAATGMSVKEIEALALRVSREFFWDPYPGLGFLRGRKLQEVMAREIGADFKSLAKPLRISVFDIVTRKTKVFSSGPLARVVRASCSVPLMFHPVKIDHRFYWDGGVKDKLGIHGLPAEEKILSHCLEGWGGDEGFVANRGPNLLKVKLKGLPRSGPFKLDRGPQIIESAHRAAMIQIESLLTKE